MRKLVSSQESSQGFATMSSAIEYADNYNLWILSLFATYIGESLLEIGTGQGNFKRYLPEVKYYLSTDIDAEVIQRAQQRDPKGCYLQADVTAPNWCELVGAQPIDTILCINVLEHIANTAAAVHNLMRILQPGGHLLLFVPAFPALYSEMDRLAGHVMRYRKQDIQQLFADQPARIVRLGYFNAIGGVGWWVNQYFPHKNLDSQAINRQIEFFDRYVVPIAKRVDYVTHAFFGQSVIAVIQKVEKKLGISK